jgi:hypothetical protein
MFSNAQRRQQQQIVPLHGQKQGQLSPSIPHPPFLSPSLNMVCSDGMIKLLIHGWVPFLLTLTPTTLPFLVYMAFIEQCSIGWDHAIRGEFS